MSKHIEGQCPVCKRSFTPRRVRLETMVYCSQKCCNFTSTSPDAVTEKSAERDVILAREWAAIEWAQEQMTQLDKEQGLLGVKPLFVGVAPNPGLVLS